MKDRTGTEKFLNALYIMMIQVGEDDVDFMMECYHKIVETLAADKKEKIS